MSSWNPLGKTTYKWYKRNDKQMNIAHDLEEVTVTCSSIYDLKVQNIRNSYTDKIRNDNFD